MSSLEENVDHRYRMKVLLTIESIYTKLGDFVKLGLHFLTMWINSCKSDIIYRLVPSPSRFEIRQ